MGVLPVTSSYQIQSSVYSSAGMVNILYACIKWHMKWIFLAYKHIVCAAAFQMTKKNHCRSKSTKKPYSIGHCGIGSSHRTVAIFRHVCKMLWWFPGLAVACVSWWCRIFLWARPRSCGGNGALWNT